MKNWKENLKVEDGEFITSYYSQIFEAEIQILFLDTENKIGLKQTELVSRLIEKETDWAKNVMASIIKYYHKTYSDYRKGWELGGANEKTIEEVLPKEIDTKKLLQLITPEEVYIKPEKDCKIGNFGFTFTCSWDEEHGIGLCFNNWKVTVVGGMDEAFCN